MKTGRMKSDGMGEMGAFENELQWTIAFSGIGKKSGEGNRYFTPHDTYQPQLSAIFLFLVLLLSVSCSDFPHASFPQPLAWKDITDKSIWEECLLNSIYPAVNR